MVNQTIYSLIERFQRLELHAAQSGREVLSALVGCVIESKAENLEQLTIEIQEIIKTLLPFLPPYSPPLNSLNQIMIALESAEKGQDDLEVLRQRISALGNDLTPPQHNHRVIAEHLAPVLPNKVTVYTHTLSETVLGVLLLMHQKGQIQKVFVTESRPNNDGWVTAEKLIAAGVETRLALDAGFPEVARSADVMLSGAEIINPDGSVVCKVGVYPSALYCRIISKPVYIIADTNKINPFEDSKFNMTPISLADLGVINAPDRLETTGSYFDITPAELVTGYVTEHGLLTAKEVHLIAKNQPVSEWLKSHLLELAT
jgi:translation initiation factor 2B subunit (eIF-2B alpha/beta/delta family)